MKQELASIISSDESMPGAYLVWLESPRIAADAKPGQFVMVRCGGETLLRRPLSIHQIADKTKVALLFTIVGKGTHWLSQRQAGEKLDLLGPLGNADTLQSPFHNLLVVAGGLGVAPLALLPQTLAIHGSAV